MNGPTPHDLWAFLIPGYLATVAIETPVLLVGLSRPHSWRRRVAAGIWLNACSYPIVTLAMPMLIGVGPRWLYLTVAEIFAPVCECTMFALAFHTPEIGRADRVRDLVTITLANLTSFLVGVWLTNHHWLG
jgi:hypothetical protein